MSVPAPGNGGTVGGSVFAPVHTGGVALVSTEFSVASAGQLLPTAQETPFFRPTALVQAPLQAWLARRFTRNGRVHL